LEHVFFTSFGTDLLALFTARLSCYYICLVQTGQMSYLHCWQLYDTSYVLFNSRPQESHLYILFVYNFEYFFSSCYPLQVKKVLPLNTFGGDGCFYFGTSPPNFYGFGSFVFLIANPLNNKASNSNWCALSIKSSVYSFFTWNLLLMAFTTCVIFHRYDGSRLSILEIIFLNVLL
jgi:hypothetical protein